MNPTQTLYLAGFLYIASVLVMILIDHFRSKKEAERYASLLKDRNALFNELKNLKAEVAISNQTYDSSINALSKTFEVPVLFEHPKFGVLSLSHHGIYNSRGRLVDMTIGLCYAGSI